VTVNELIDAMQHLENIPADAKNVEEVAEVLSLMDDDKDGVIQADHVMKVIELLGTTQTKLTAKQIKQIADMLAKEDMLHLEEESAGGNGHDETLTDQTAAAVETEIAADNSEITNVMSDTTKDGQEDIAAKDLSDTENVPTHIKEMFDENSAKVKQSDSEKRVSEKQKGGPK